MSNHRQNESGTGFRKGRSAEALKKEQATIDATKSRKGTSGIAVTRKVTGGPPASCEKSKVERQCEMKSYEGRHRTYLKDTEGTTSTNVQKREALVGPAVNRREGTKVVVKTKEGLSSGVVDKNKSTTGASIKTRVDDKTVSGSLKSPTKRKEGSQRIKSGEGRQVTAAKRKEVAVKNQEGTSIKDKEQTHVVLQKKDGGPRKTAVWVRQRTQERAGAGSQNKHGGRKVGVKQGNPKACSAEVIPVDETMSVDNGRPWIREFQRRTATKFTERDLSLDEFVSAFCEDLLRQVAKSEEQDGLIKAKGLDTKLHDVLSGTLQCLTEEETRNRLDEDLAGKLFEDGITNLVDDMLQRIVTTLSTSSESVPLLDLNEKQQHQIVVKFPKTASKWKGECLEVLQGDFEATIGWEWVSGPEDPEEIKESIAKMDAKNHIWIGNKVEKSQVIAIPPNRRKIKQSALSHKKNLTEGSPKCFRTNCNQDKSEKQELEQPPSTLTDRKPRPKVQNMPTSQGLNAKEVKLTRMDHKPTGRSEAVTFKREAVDNVKQPLSKTPIKKPDSPNPRHRSHQEYGATSPHSVSKKPETVQSIGEVTNGEKGPKKKSTVRGTNPVLNKTQGQDRTEMKCKYCDKIVVLTDLPTAGAKIDTTKSVISAKKDKVAEKYVVANETEQSPVKQKTKKSLGSKFKRCFGRSSSPNIDNDES